MENTLLNRLFRNPDMIIPAMDGFPEVKVKQYTPLYCKIMNVLDIRFWFCKSCGYNNRFGLCYAQKCKRHGIDLGENNA